MRHSRRYTTISANREVLTRYDVADAVKIVKGNATAKFDETVEVAANLGVDPRHADQQVRGTVALPHGTVKSVSVLVLAQGDKVKEAESAGADHVGGEELAKKIMRYLRGTSDKGIVITSTGDESKLDVFTDAGCVGADARSRSGVGRGDNDRNAQHRVDF